MSNCCARGTAARGCTPAVTKLRSSLITAVSIGLLIALGIHALSNPALPAFSPLPGDDPGHTTGAASADLSVTGSGALKLRIAEDATQSIVEHSVRISAVGEGELEYRASSSKPWLTVTPSAGHLQSGAGIDLSIALEPEAGARLSTGEHRGSIALENLSGGFGTLQLDVIVSVEVSTEALRPGPGNTGPRAGSKLIESGSITAKTDGQVIENVSIRGNIVIRANNVTVRNFRIDAGGAPYGIQTGLSEYTGTIIEDGEISGAQSAGIFGSDFQARRVQIHEIGGDGIKARDNVIVEGCWIHHLGMKPGAHADGNQTRGGKHIVFRGNFIDMPVRPAVPGEQQYLSNAAFMISDEVSPIEDFVIESNWLNGGNYTIMIKAEDFGGPKKMRVSNNRFGRGYQFGPLRLSGAEITLDGNVWDDTGEPVRTSDR